MSINDVGAGQGYQQPVGGLIGALAGQAGNDPLQGMRRKRNTLILYLKEKIEEGDWHGVSDAANDLRVLEAKHPGLVP